MHTPTAESKVVVRDRNPLTKEWSPWRDSFEFDPITLPVEDHNATRTPVLTDTFHSNVIAVVDALVAADQDPNVEHQLVWSDSGKTVKGTCPVCDAVFSVSEGYPGDELNEGYDAVFCGCDPADYRDED
jgi:uncharacterized Zn-finger protein